MARLPAPALAPALDRRAHVAALDEHVATLVAVRPQPAFLPAPLGLEVASYHQMRDPRGGGDFYDLTRTAATVAERWTLTLGDVAGHDNRSSGLAGLAAQVTHTSAFLGVPPRALLSAVNEALLRATEGDRLLTALTLALTSSPEGVGATLTLAGHPPPWLCSPGVPPALVGVPGLSLGVFEDVHSYLTPTRLQLRPGDLLVCCTDGLTEARSPAGEFFEDYLPGILAHLTRAPVSATELLAGIRRALDGWTRSCGDDVTVIVLGLPWNSRADCTV